MMILVLSIWEFNSVICERTTMLYHDKALWNDSQQNLLVPMALLRKANTIHYMFG